jgi:ZIP family zinc transporter
MSLEQISAVAPRPWQKLLWALLPLALLIAALWWLLAGNLLQHFGNGAPPVENLTVERTILDQNGLRLLVRGGGSEAMTIAQVQVDAAYWRFTQDPTGPIARGSSAWIAIPFPWVLAEAHKVTFVTNTGATFEHDIPVAVETPQVTSLDFAAQAMLGAFVGIVPVVIGLLFYPALRGAGPTLMSFLLAMTIGLLVFLLIDTMEDALEFAERSAAIFQGPMMVILAAAASFILLLGISRRQGQPSGLALATYIAIGIGLHNLGEGLAIGAAFAAGAASWSWASHYTISPKVSVSPPPSSSSGPRFRISQYLRSSPADPPSSACGREASLTRRTGRPWHSPAGPAPYCRSSSRSAASLPVHRKDRHAD